MQVPHWASVNAPNLWDIIPLKNCDDEFYEVGLRQWAVAHSFHTYLWHIGFVSLLSTLAFDCACVPIDIIVCFGGTWNTFIHSIHLLWCSNFLRWVESLLMAFLAQYHVYVNIWLEYLFSIIPVLSNFEDEDVYFKQF